MTKHKAFMEQETIDFANYIIEKSTTIRDTAKYYGTSKSKVHERLVKHLRCMDYTLFSEVQKILIRNRAERHIRGGMATKQKFLVE